MKKILSNVWVRVATYIVGVISAVVLAASVMAMVFMYAVETKEKFLEDGYQAIVENYLAGALDTYFENPDAVNDVLDGTNLYCVIIKDAPLEDGKYVYDDESTYVFSNVPDGVNPEFEYTFWGERGAYIGYNTQSLFGALNYPYIHGVENTYATVSVDKIVLDTNNNLFYFKTGVGYFLMDYVYVKEDGLYYDYILDTVNGKRCYYNSYFDKTLDMSTYESWTGIGWYQVRWTIDPNQTDKAFEAVSDSNIIKEQLMNTKYYVMDEIHYDSMMNPVYTVAAMMAPNFEENDLLKEWSDTVERFYSLENSLIIYAFISAIFFIASLVVLIYTAKGDKENLKFIHKCPLLIYLGCITAAEVSLGTLIAMAIYAIDDGALNASIETLIFIFVLLAALMIWILLWCISNLATRIKSRTLFRYSVLYYISRPLVKLGGVLRETLHRIRENVPLFWKVAISVVVIDIVEIFIFIACIYAYSSGLLEFFVAYKIVQFVAIIVIAFQMNELQKGSVRIANGELEKPIDTSKMFWEFKKHGENINKVGDGISKAVENQLKSERFKTELITNVSHDIKTPLTSIINYVDLIKKEEYTDPTLCEYVEVLDRQSARLKKLIEDLMEASKASTGNLKVELEECDISMLIGQVAGEFEDRFTANGLQIIVTKPEEPIYVMADGRHMWRVLDNLMNNINKYSLSNSRVYIQLEKLENKAVVHFKNISKTQLNISSEELMERFVRGDSSRNTEGSGLGLSIAQSLTELMGGAMELNIDGDLFKVTLTFDVK